MNKNGYPVHNIYQGDTRKILPQLPDKSMDIIITSPPYYGLKDYGYDEQIGLESTLEEYINEMRIIFTECYRLLSEDGLLWLNIGDTYFSYWGNKNYTDTLPSSARNGYNENKRPKFKPNGWQKDKQKCLIPFRIAIMLQEIGFIVRNDCCWHKPNYRREASKHRLDNSKEYWFLCCKNAKTKSFTKGELSCDLWIQNIEKVNGHNAVFPITLIQKILKQCQGETVLDPFMGSGTILEVCQELGKVFTGIEMNKDYVKLAIDRVGLENVNIFLQN